MLFLHADLHHQGVIFPAYHVVGTEWDGEAYDGVETEGLGLLAKLVGQSCFGLPGFVAEHATHR